MSTSFHELQREILRLGRDCREFIAGQQESMQQLKKTYNPSATASTPSTPAAPAAAPAPAERRRWRYVGEDGLIPAELSQQACRNPQLFAAILQEVQELADESKSQD